MFSVILSSRSYKVLANKFHDCGREIAEIYDQVCLWKSNSKNVTEEDLKDMIKQYNFLLKKYDINHSRLDYEMFIRDNISEYKNIRYPFIFKLKIEVRHLFDTVLRYWLFILIPVILYLIFREPCG